MKKSELKKLVKEVLSEGPIKVSNTGYAMGKITSSTPPAKVAIEQKTGMAIFYVGGNPVFQAKAKEVTNMLKNW